MLLNENKYVVSKKPQILSFSFIRLFTQLLFPFLFLYYFHLLTIRVYEGWNFNSGNYLFTTDTK